MFSSKHADTMSDAKVLSSPSYNNKHLYFGKRYVV